MATPTPEEFYKQQRALAQREEKAEIRFNQSINELQELYYKDKNRGEQESVAMTPTQVLILGLFKKIEGLECKLYTLEESIDKKFDRIDSEKVDFSSTRY